MTLYELTNEYKRLYDMAEEMDLSPYDLKDTLDGMDEELSKKADGYGKVIRQMEADSDAIDAEIKRLTDKKKRIQNNIGSMKRSLESTMIELGKKKIKTPLFGFNIQKNPPSVNILDESKVPDNFRIKQPDKIDRKSIIAELKESGNTDWAELVQTESLRIR